MLSESKKNRLEKKRVELRREHGEERRWQSDGGWASRGRRTIFSRVCHPVATSARDSRLIASGGRDSILSRPTWATLSHSWPADATRVVGMQGPTGIILLASA
jgi:hypothetical protein